jgi:hypothetical protein
MGYNCTHMRPKFWHAFLSREQRPRWATQEVSDFQPGKDYGNLARATHEEEEDDDEDAPPVACLTTMMMPHPLSTPSRSRKRREEAEWMWGGLDEVVRLTAMVKQHTTSSGGAVTRILGGPAAQKPSFLQ